MDRLFVYGSLQPGGDNEHILAPLNGTWEAGSVRGNLAEEGWGAGLGYPGLHIDESGPPVPGYLFSSERLTDFWPELDEFEGQEYQRCRIEVTLESGGKVSAQVYAIRAAGSQSRDP